MSQEQEMVMPMTPIQPGTEAQAAAAAFSIFGSDIPPVDPATHQGWRTALGAVAEEWAREGEAAARPKS
ncbi:hypothetical protein [Streptomyces buecherae]|uniref:hypothetical protein n=1 Tax=Streptomyces buecherae TaxID=2763006 RepID=UPI00378B3ED3